MVYDLIFNAAKQAMQLQEPMQMSNQDLGELLGVLNLLEKMKISAEKMDIIKAMREQLEKETLRRSLGDIIIIIFYSDADLTTMVGNLTIEERTKILKWLDEYSSDQNGRKISAEERAKIRKCLASF